MHRLRPGIKLLSLTVCGTIIFMVSSVSVLSLLLLLVALLYVIAQVPFKKVVQQFRLIGPFLIFIFVFHTVFDNWLVGLKVILRFIILIFLAFLVPLTTKVSDMMESVEGGLRPFQRFGVNPSKLSIVLSMAIRFIPVIIEKFNEVREAQRARGLDAHITVLAIPLIIRTMRMASEVAEALEARSYDTVTDSEISCDDKNSILKE